MNCSEAEQLFDAYLDRQLTGSLQLELDVHRLHCGRCRQMLAMMEACEHIVATDSHGPDVSDDFTARVMTQIERTRPAPRIIRFKRVAALAGILVPAAAAVLVVMVGSRGQQDGPLTPGGRVPPTITDRIHDAYTSDDRDEAWNLMYSAIDDGVTQLRAARAILTNDISVLRRYAMDFSLPADDYYLPRFFRGSEPEKKREPSQPIPGTHSL